MGELLLAKGKVAVSVLFDTVSIELSYKDAYVAQVVYDEIIDRLRRGEGLKLELGQPEPLSPDQWDCRCGYQNTGPICTKCGQLRQGQRR